MNTTTSRTERIEGVVQVVILLAVGVMAGAASFTHVHDWTMHNSPKGTADWFGWANAVISELTPIAAGLEARRRARQNRSIRFPVAVLLASIALSLAAQFAVAKPGVSGWLISAVPALAFMALVKLVISRTPATTAASPVTTDPATTEPIATQTFATAGPAAEVEVPAALVMSTNLLAAQHHATTGQPLPAATLADRLGVDHNTATRLLTATGVETTPVPARVNGHAPAGVATR